jgi:hypothetical protein
VKSLGVFLGECAGPRPMPLGFREFIPEGRRSARLYFWRCCGLKSALRCVSLLTHDVLRPACASQILVALLVLGAATVAYFSRDRKPHPISFPGSAAPEDAAPYTQFGEPGAAGLQPRLGRNLGRSGDENYPSPAWGGSCLFSPI